MKKTRLVLVLVLFVLLFSFVPIEVTAQNSAQVCGPDGDISTMLAQITQTSVEKWLRDFSGENSVLINGVPRTIKTRYSHQLFVNNPNAMAYDYLHQELLKLGYVEDVTLTDHSYNYPKSNVLTEEILIQPDDELSYLETEQSISSQLSMPQAISPDDKAVWKNKIVTIPGHGPNADKFVLMTAHLDSTSNAANTLAPGAEDNGSGVSALMEAAYWLRFYKFDYTIKLIFFTGEEQRLEGSAAYVANHPEEMGKILGVVNLDMFGYDNDQDMCIELHVGEMASSNIVGTCFTDVNNNYNLGLSHDYITTGAIWASDHASFWNAGVGAIEILENMDAHPASNPAYGCGGRKDENPHYHRITDTIDKMYMPATFATVKAGVGTVASLANPMGKCFGGDPVLKATTQEESVLLTWQALAGAETYNVYRGTATCQGAMTQIAQVTTNSFEDTNIQFDRNYFYKIEAVDNETVCRSQLSNCAIAKVPTPQEPVEMFDLFLPLVIAGQ
ncbi:MAG: M28 family peptidase [Chloroflexi bacterium]|nr:M28 family peptidase [Chloroflexota bacterium]